MIQLAQPIRLLLKYAGIEFDNVVYEQGDGTYVCLSVLVGEMHAP